MTHDWSDACDPVPAKRELSAEERLAKLKRIERIRRAGGWVNLKAQAPSTHRVEPDFDEMGA